VHLQYDFQFLETTHRPLGEGSQRKWFESLYFLFISLQNCYLQDPSYYTPMPGNGNGAAGEGYSGGGGRGGSHSAPFGGSKKLDDTCKLFVGGLHPNTNSDTLKSFYSQFGELVSCEVTMSGERSKCFGFVSFASDDQVSLQLS
jgi:hypothetical protein